MTDHYNENKYPELPYRKNDKLNKEEAKQQRDAEKEARKPR